MNNFKSTRKIHAPQLRAVASVLQKRAADAGLEELPLGYLDEEGAFLLEALHAIPNESQTFMRAFSHYCQKVVFMNTDMHLFEMFTLGEQPLTKTRHIFEAIENSGTDVVLIYKDMQFTKNIFKVCATVILGYETFESVAPTLSSAPSAIVTNLKELNCVAVSAPLYNLV